MTSLSSCVQSNSQSGRSAWTLKLNRPHVLPPQSCQVIPGLPPPGSGKAHLELWSCRDTHILASLASAVSRCACHPTGPRRSRCLRRPLKARQGGPMNGLVRRLRLGRHPLHHSNASGTLSAHHAQTATATATHLNSELVTLLGIFDPIFEVSRFARRCDLVCRLGVQRRLGGWRSTTIEFGCFLCGFSLFLCLILPFVFGIVGKVLNFQLRWRRR